VTALVPVWPLAYVLDLPIMEGVCYWDAIVGITHAMAAVILAVCVTLAHSHIRQAEKAHWTIESASKRSMAHISDRGLAGSN